MAISLTVQFIIGFVIGLVMLLFSTNYLLKSVEVVSKKMRVSYFILGFLIMAIGTSVPEMAISFISTTLGKPAISLANITGSIIADICIVIGAAAFFGLKTDRKIANAALVFLGLSSLLIFFLFDGGLAMWESLLLLMLGIAYFAYVSRKETKKAMPVVMSKEPLFVKSYFYIPLLIFWLLLSSFLVVFFGSGLAVAFGLPVTFIGFILLAVGTAMPEALSTVIIMLRGHAPDFVWGTMLGGNIVNIFLGVGAGPLFGKYQINFGEFFYQFAFMLITTAVVYLMLRFKKKLDWRDGLILFGLYAVTLYFVLTGVPSPIK